MNDSPSTNVLDQVFEPFAMSLSREAAEQIANYRADTQLQARVDYLADRANAGVLTPKEAADYDRLLDGLHVVTILQAKARAALRKDAVR